MGYELPDVLMESTSVAFVTFCQNHSVRPFTLGADKHGSYVWEAGAVADGLTRYITLGLTLEVEVGDRRVDVLRSIIIGADDGEHFTNARMVEVPYWSVDEYLANVQSKLARDLEAAWLLALRLGPEMLSESYLTPRPSTQETLA
jgi:hypothetical protein